jgi:hypothetical protein
MIPVTKGQPSAPAFWVEPTAVRYDTNNATLGTIFNVTVWGSVAVDTRGWQVNLEFDSSELQAVAVDYTTGTPSEFFAGHTKYIIYPSIDNEAGTILAGEILFDDHVGPTSGSLFSVTFQIIAAPGQGQSITSLIDPTYDIDSFIISLFIDTNNMVETPLSTVPCRYTYCDSAVSSPNPTFVYCSRNPVRANRPVTCIATVSGVDPTGTIAWLTDSSTGWFSPSVSDLTSGNCSTTYTDSSPGIATITACYSGDSYNTPSNGSTILKVKTQTGQSWTYVSCARDFAYVNSPVTIYASVSSSDQMDIIPTGTITWSTDSSTGSFTPSISTLSFGSCSTAYIDASPGIATITASYGGDLFNYPSQAYLTLEVKPQLVIPSAFLLNVPYHRQIRSYYCGPAALEEVFHYYGPDIPQTEIADVARTASDGTYSCDMVRAAHFSSLSTSIGNESSVSYTGYTARKLGYAALECGGMTIEELKSVIAQGYPVIVLTTWHFRVAVGYDDKFIIFQDPYYGTLCRMTYSSFSTDWDYSGHWGLLVSPWHVDITNSHNVLQGDEFNVMATITYPWVDPFQYWPQATSANVTVTLPPGLSLAAGETAQKAYEIPVLGPGQSFNVSWTVEAQALGNYRINVEAEGLVNGYMPPLPNGYSEYAYEDRIGGTNQSTVAVTSNLDVSPPVTADDYDGIWHNHSFNVNLSVNDDMTGALETFYHINNGVRKAVSLNGQPMIETSNMNNTLEYWSIDWAGNEELPHKLLTGVKLDLTKPVFSVPVRAPAAEVQPHEPVRISVNVTDEVSGIQNVTLQYSLDSGVTWIAEAMALNVSTGLYEAGIPGQPAGTLVKYRLTACDWAGNNAVRPDSGQNYSYQVQFLEASVIPDRETLNLGYNGQWLTFQIGLPEGYSVGDIDISSLKLNGTVTADSSMTDIVDLDNSEIQELAACFNRTLVSQFVLSSSVTTGNVTLDFSGTLNDGSLFEGTCTIGVRMRGDTNLDGKVDMQDIATTARAFGSFQGQPSYKGVLDENEDNRIDLKDIALIARNFGKVYL